jgi:hypothetical protein
MRKINIAGALAGAGILVATVAGCTPHHAADSAKAKAELATPQAKEVQAQVKACISKGGGHTAVINCIVPPKNKPLFEKCAGLAIAGNFTNKVKLENDLTLCVVNDR